MTATQRTRRRRRKPGPKPGSLRPKLPSLEEQERLLSALVELIHYRRGVIADVTMLREEEDERHQEVMRLIRENHTAANEELIKTFDLLYDRGIPKKLMYERMGLSRNRIDELRVSTARRREKEAKEGRDMSGNGSA